jgi:hypothetical protein
MSSPLLRTAYVARAPGELRAARETLNQALHGQKTELSLPDFGGYGLDVLVAHAVLGYRLIVENYPSKPAEVTGLERMGAPAQILVSELSYPDVLRFYFGNPLSSRYPNYPDPGLPPASTKRELAIAIRDGLSSTLDAGTEAGRIWREYLGEEDAEDPAAICRAVVRTWWRAGSLPDVSELPAVVPFVESQVAAFKEHCEIEERAWYGPREDWD